MVAVLVVNHSRDLTPNHILEVYIAPLPNRIPRTHDNVQTKTLWCKKINLSYQNQIKTPRAHGPSVIIVQVQVHAIIVHVQTLLVNFVIANSIQGTIISIIALTCCDLNFYALPPEQKTLLILNLSSENDALKDLIYDMFVLRKSLLEC